MKIIFYFFIFLLMVDVPLYSAAIKAKKIAIPAPELTYKKQGEIGMANSAKEDVAAQAMMTGGKYADSNDFNNDTVKYQKISLKDVILEAISCSNLAKASREQVKQSKIKLEDAYSAYYPKIDFTYNDAKKKETPGDTVEGIKNKDKRYRDTSRIIEYSQNLYSGGATTNKIKSLKEDYKNAKNKYKIVVALEMQKAIKAYFGVVFNNKSVLANEKNMKKLNKVLEIVTAKYDAGAVSLGDISSIKASVANSQTKLIKVQSKFSEALKYYEYVAGKHLEKTLPFEDSFNTKVDTFEKLYKKALEDNMNLINYKFDIQASKFKIKSYKGAFRPKIDFEMSSEDILDAEVFEESTNTYLTKFKVSYNLYNGGQDEKKILTEYSKIREANYKKSEEIKKLKYDLSRTFSSVQILKGAIDSKELEIEATNEMVDAYWEGFKLGEQDLSVLLQAQRQLNEAELEFIKLKENNLNDFFKILESTNSLVNFFEIDIDADNFVDFAGSKYNNFDIKNGLDLKSLSSKNIASTETNATEKIDIPIELKMNEYLGENNDTIVKKIDDLNITNELNTTIEITEDIKTENNVSSIDSNITDQNATIPNKEIVVKKLPKKKVKKFKTDTKFKKKFLNAPEDFYSINIVSFSAIKYAQALLQKEKIAKNSFVFKYGKNKEWVKVMYGVYELYDDASIALDEIKNIKKKYSPVVEKIKAKQRLYYRYNDYENLFVDNKKYVKKEPIKVVKRIKINEKEPIKKDLVVDKKNDKIIVSNEIKKDKVSSNENIEEKLILDDAKTEVIKETKKVVKKEVIDSNKTKIDIKKPIEVVKNKIEKKKANTLKKVAKKEIKKSKFDKMSKSVKNAPDSFYTIVLTTIDKNRAKWFVDRYSVEKNYGILPVGKHKVSILHGMYKTRDEAIEASSEIHPTLNKQNPPIRQIVDIRKKEVKKEQKKNLKKEVRKEQKKILKKEVKITNINSISDENIKNSNFKEVLDKAPNTHYTIVLTIIKKTRVEWFLRRYSVDGDYVLSDFGKDKVKILYGVFKTKEDAIAIRETIHPYLNKLNPPIKEIKDIR